MAIMLTAPATTTAANAASPGRAAPRAGRPDTAGPTPCAPLSAGLTPCAKRNSALQLPASWPAVFAVGMSQQAAG